MWTAVLFAAIYVFFERDPYSIPRTFLVFLALGLSLLFFSLTITTFFTDSKLAISIGILCLISPMIVYHAFKLYVFTPTNYLPIVFSLSFLPHFPGLALLRYYIGAQPSTAPDYQLSPLCECLLFALMLLQIPFQMGVFLFFDRVATGRRLLCTATRRR